MMSYLFDFGDSNTGPIGACIRVRAETREQALAKVRQHLQECYDVTEHGYTDDVEYAHVYFNPDNITVDNIDDEEEIDDE